MPSLDRSLATLSQQFRHTTVASSSRCSTAADAAKQQLQDSSRCSTAAQADVAAVTAVGVIQRATEGVQQLLDCVARAADCALHAYLEAADRAGS
jgi:hypothetical protein